MKAKRGASSRRDQRVHESARRTDEACPEIPDSAIDFSDIPELSDEELRTMRRVGRPPAGDATKVSIAFRINPNLLARLRELAAKRGKPYQTLMHELLEAAAARRR